MRYEAVVEAYKNDPVSFAIDFGKLKDGNGLSFDGKFEFVRDLIWLFQRTDRVIVSKKRDQGVSWSLMEFVVWRMFMKQNTNVLLVTNNVASATSAYRLVQFLFEGLSDGLEYDVDHPEDQNAFLDLEKPFVLFNGSTFTAMPSTSTNIENKSADLVVFDEVQSFPSNAIHVAKTMFRQAEKSIMIGTMFNAEEGFKRDKTWFDSYIDFMQFVDEVRVVRL